MLLFLLPLLLISVVACSSPTPEAPPKKTSSLPSEAMQEPIAAQGGDLGYGEDAKLFDTAGHAVAHILAQRPDAKVLGFGEFHKLTSSKNVKSALRQFAEDILSVVGHQSAHLVLESWAVDPRCGSKGSAVTEKIEKAIERPKESETEMTILLRKLETFGMKGHLLSFACDEYDQLLSKGQLDHERLLSAVSAKLGEKVGKILNSEKSDKMILVYGGSTHNDLFPYKGLESWSYAQDIATSTKSGFVEIDLYVPEFITGDTLLSEEPWYPLLKEARTDQVILIRRDPRSYILLLKKENGGDEKNANPKGH